MPNPFRNILHSKHTKEKEEKIKILEQEKIFRKGIASIKDLLAPSSVVLNPSYMQLGGKYVRTLFVSAYPRYLTTNWFSPIINLPTPLDISLFIYPVDSSHVLKQLRNKVAQIQSTMTMEADRGQVRDPQLETALADTEELRDRLIQGTEKFFHVTLYITLYADSLQSLNQKTDMLETMLASSLVYIKVANLQMEQGFNSTMPLGNDELVITNNLNTSPLSTLFPFTSSNLTSNEGVLYGINRHNNGLILFDRFNLENANMVIFAKSGMGKSYFQKLEIIRSMMLGVEFIVIDPENEYRTLCDAVGGKYINVSINSEHRLNPFDLPVKTSDEEPNAEALIRSNIINLLALMNIMLGELTPAEDSIMDTALKETYAKRDITEDTENIRAKEMPVMGDLAEILDNMEGGKDLSLRLKRFTEGIFAGIFNKPSNVNLDNPLIVFSIRDLEEELRPIAMFIILNYIWNKIRSEMKRRILVVDEAWILMQFEQSATFLKNIAKRARKYYLGVTTITQDVGDFFSSPQGQPIVNNSSLQLLLGQSPASIDTVVNAFKLTEGERHLLLNSEIGEGIMFAGPKHAAIKIIASYTEDQIITTDPKQLLEIEKAKEEYRKAMDGGEDQLAI